MRRNNHAIQKIVVFIAALLCGSSLWAQSPTVGQAPFIQVLPNVEVGMLAVLSHTFQSGAGTTAFNFLTQGGQDILFPYQRYSVDFVLAAQHHVTFLYQPLTLATRTVADRNGTNGGQNVVIGDAVFAPGTAMDISYGFDFWRVSYFYDFFAEPSTVIGIGASLQIRNASIAFTAVNGATRFVSQNIGPVPILKVRAAHRFSPAFGLDLEADGFYASSAFFNGATQPFTGWVWDASLSALTSFMPGMAAHITLRSIGGGAEGNNAYSYVSATASGPGAYTKNVLATFALSLGVSLE
jgi:hypothetical protein